MQAQDDQQGVGIDSLFQSALQFSQQMLNGENGQVDMSQILSGLGNMAPPSAPSGTESSE